jgi:hypothetical protein
MGVAVLRPVITVLSLLLLVACGDDGSTTSELGAPSGVTATAAVRGASLTWIAPSETRGAVTGYAVTVQPGGMTLMTPSAASTFDVTGLENGTSYRFTVAAVDALGMGPASAESAPITTPDVPAAPTNVSAVAGDGEATVSWTAPPANGSALTGYTITVSPGGATAVASATASSTVVSGLANGTAYTFTVTAQNAVGASAPSIASLPVTLVRLPGSPTNVVATAGNSAASVTWTAPAPNGSGAITGYTVTSSPGGFTANAAANQTTATVTGLTNGSSYTFTVRATTADGAGAASVASNAVTPMTVPTAPAITLVTRGNAQVTVSWTAPANNGGSVITGYVVTSNPGAITATSNGTTTSVAVTGLTNGTPYVFTVRAQNAAGDGPESAASTPVTPATVPGAPTAVGATAGNAKATVSWIPPASNGGSVITGYTVTSSPGNLMATT